MLIRFGTMGPESFLSGWTAEPITKNDATRRRAHPFNIKSHHVQVEGAVEPVIMVIRFPSEMTAARGKKPAVVWEEHYLDLTPQQFGYAVSQSLGSGVLDVRAEKLPYWRQQHSNRLAFVAKTTCPYANGP